MVVFLEDAGTIKANYDVDSNGNIRTSPQQGPGGRYNAAKGLGKGIAGERRYRRSPLRHCRHDINASPCRTGSMREATAVVAWLAAVCVYGAAEVLPEFPSRGTAAAVSTRTACWTGMREAIAAAWWAGAWRCYLRSPPEAGPPSLSGS